MVSIGSIVFGYCNVYSARRVCRSHWPICSRCRWRSRASRRNARKRPWTRAEPNNLKKRKFYSVLNRIDPLELNEQLLTYGIAHVDLGGDQDGKDGQHDDRVAVTQAIYPEIVVPVRSLIGRGQVLGQLDNLDVLVPIRNHFQPHASQSMSKSKCQRYIQVRPHMLLSFIISI